MTIICGTDFSAASEAACAVAALLAKEHDEMLLIVHAMSEVTLPPAYVATMLLEDMRASAERVMQELAKRIEVAPERLMTRVHFGTADEMILSEAEEHDARLVVLGSVGQRGAKWQLGSTAERVVSRSRVPVFIVRGDFPAAEWIARNRPLRVAVAADLSPDDERARRLERLEQLAKAGPEKRNVRCEILVGDDPARLIGAAAERFGADMICVGSRGRSGLTRALLGSVSQSLLLRSRRPVLVVQSPV